jgi:uncharacterized membrane protein YadS
MAYRYRVESADANKEAINLASIFPAFILGFVAMALVRTVGDATLANGMAYGVLSAEQLGQLTHTIQEIANFLLAVAMAAVGLGPAPCPVARARLKTVLTWALGRQ